MAKDNRRVQMYIFPHSRKAMEKQTEAVKSMVKNVRALKSLKSLGK